MAYYFSIHYSGKFYLQIGKSKDKAEHKIKRMDCQADQASRMLIGSLHDCYTRDLANRLLIKNSHDCYTRFCLKMNHNYFLCLKII